MSLFQRRLRPNAPIDHLAARWTQAMSDFDQMVSSMTKPSRTAANQFPGPADTLRRAFTSSTSPLALAASQYRADMLEARRLSATEEGCGDAVSAAEHAFRERAEEAIPLRTVRDALTAVEWVRTDLAESSADHPDDPDCPADVVYRHLLLTGAADLLREVQEAGAVVFSAQALETTRIPELGITFAKAAERYHALRRDETEASRRGDQDATDAASRGHCRIADQIMDAHPVTPADALVILSMLADPVMGIAAGIDEDRAQRALEQVYALLSTAGQPLSQSKASELSAMVCRWLELRDIASPSKRQSAELERLAGRIAAYQPHSTADAMAHLGFVLAYYMGDSTFDLESDDSSYARALQKGLAYFANAGDPAAGTLYRLGSIGLTNARAFWVNPEAGGEVARLEHREAEAFRGEADDDAELLDLWRRYLPLKAEAERIDEAGDLEGWMRAHEPCNALEKRMATVPARTPTGIAVKLAVLWQWGGAVVEHRGRNNERENGPDRLSDHMVQWLWMIMNEARALGAPMPLLPNDTTTDMATAAEDSRRLVLEIESEAPVDPVADAEGAEEEDLPVVDRTGSGLSKAEVRFTNVLDRMGPDDKEGLILTGEAMIALGDAMKAAQKAAAIDRRWSEFFAKLLREDAAKLHPEGDSGLVAANGDSATADPFSDAVKDIGAQAPATLSMPLEMTDRMVDAGASAAGITPEQFKAAVIAARDARAA